MNKKEFTKSLIYSTFKKLGTPSKNHNLFLCKSKANVVGVKKQQQIFQKC